MRIVLRTIAVLIVIAGIADPALTVTVSRPAAVELAVPPASHPDHSRAAGVRDRVADDFRDAARFEAADAPLARLAIGRPRAHTDPMLGLFAVPLAPAAIEIAELRGPERVLAGQQIELEARLRGRGLDGRSSAIQMRVDGVTVATVGHRWSRADETHTARFVVPALPAGTHRLQVAAAGNDEVVTADTSVTVSARPLRVLVFEPRPSWPVTFARRTLEADPRFELSTVARTAPGITTTSGETGAALSANRLGTFDGVVLGGLDAVSGNDLERIVDFVARRGGALILLPDARIPEHLRTRLALPALEEVLLQAPVALDGGGAKLRASELLLASKESSVTAIAGVQRDGTTRPAVFASALGQGTVVVAGAMDAWRYRSTKAQDLDRFLRTLIGDAAAAAPAPVTVSLPRSVERPGEPVSIQVAVRETEFAGDSGRIAVPRVSAAMVDEKGNREMVRLWPASRVGEFEGRATPPREGRYVIAARAGSQTADAVLTIARDVTHPRDGYPIAAVTTLTGGAVAEKPGALRARLAALGVTDEPRTVRPMRSAWWMLPFAGLLSLEWILRRRAGLR